MLFFLFIFFSVGFIKGDDFHDRLGRSEKKLIALGATKIYQYPNNKNSLNKRSFNPIKYLQYIFNKNDHTRMKSFFHVYREKIIKVMSLYWSIEKIDQLERIYSWLDDVYFFRYSRNDGFFKKNKSKKVFSLMVGIYGAAIKLKKNIFDPKTLNSVNKLFDRFNDLMNLKCDEIIYKDGLEQKINKKKYFDISFIDYVIESLREIKKIWVLDDLLDVLSCIAAHKDYNFSEDELERIKKELLDTCLYEIDYGWQTPSSLDWSN